MLALASIALLAAVPQDVPAPRQEQGGWGWSCQVEREAPGTIFILDHGTDKGGTWHTLRGARVIQMRGARQLQVLQWTDFRDQAPPTSLMLPIQLARNDPKSLVMLEHDRGSIALPASRVLHYGKRGASSILIQEEAALAALWGSAHWRISVIDRKGREIGAAEGALPGREAILRVFAELGPQLDARMKLREQECRALDANAWF